MNIIQIKENEFNVDIPLTNLSFIEVCWDFILTSLNIEELYKIIDDGRDMAALDVTYDWRHQVKSMISEVSCNYHPYAQLTYYLPVLVDKNAPISYRQDMACRVTIIRSRYYGFKSLRKIFEC
ncbi:g182 [Yersinia phage phiR1-37]|uniref:hypothetical protein n=1 Tax=Yersinia phage phiR1-37 TaxID=331278 RepID=UPI00022DBD62|nr:hypothetical protein phiR1-37_gp182 [Yersinia phage phiR1-37]CCE26206.1 g182 [Yersinia phage phiR1-37]